MREIRVFSDRATGVARPSAGCTTPALLCLGFFAAFNIGCGSPAHEENLPTLQVGMTREIQPLYDDGELRIFEVKKGLSFPILAPGATARGELDAMPMEPYGRRPWVTTADVSVQVTWTVSNLDDDEHVVELLVDPWNEFGRYYPGLQLTDSNEQEYMPNFSGIDRRYSLPGKGSGDASRVHGTYTFSDLEEVATDLATVMGLLRNPPETMEEGDDLSVVFANHAFAWDNRSYDDPLVAPWVPKTVAGLTGLDLGFRTSEPANVALEVAVEVVDEDGKRVRREGDEDKPLLPPTDAIITVGLAPP